MEMNSTWNGSLSIGVTVLTPAQVISVIKAKQLPGLSFVIAASTEKSSVLYIGGQVTIVPAGSAGISLLPTPTGNGPPPY